MNETFNEGKIDQLSWFDVKELCEINNTVVIPVGSIENQGPHLPLGLDCIVLGEIIEKILKEEEVVVAPIMPFGYAKVHQGFPGTITLRPEVLHSVLVDVASCLIKHGFRKLAFFNSHVGNGPIISQVCEVIRDNHEDVLCAVVPIWGVMPQAAPEVAKTLIPGHASDPNTSVMMYISPDLVKMERAIREEPKQLFRNFTTKAPAVYQFNGATINIPLRTDEISKSGIWGDPTVATAEKGRGLVESLVKFLLQFIREFKELEVPRRGVD
jgi:creatinine amidohydrolase